MFQNSRTLTVEWGQCDPAGIVFYPRYFEMFDASTAALFTAATGMTKYAMLEKYEAIGFPMVETRSVFHIPSRFGDEIRIESSIARFRRSSFEVLHRIYRKDALAVEGFETRVWAGRHPDDSSRIKSKPIPAELIANFGRRDAEQCEPVRSNENSNS